ncbi:CDP-alcohol phosphatidyltransferase family protein [Phycicoccus sp. Soil802]|uniref:CDP-alcohol phosphatidyltransferase family protein n=1 Tax=Phycicoccus sp. Soil802 TaxID=1736414 RepID=UPI0007039E67|nr:CDP-alcohol phosphatidyltransferase family protein [Phycicoccus sp. Soil802]KRF29826.1 CDP-diacylglycerol--glycerol-3-phosphate 3-phosphatidyltransferase [Phycicoccus sp. Soil802]
MSAPGERGRVVGEPAVTDRVLTLPNVLSVLRLVGVPIFLWAILSEHDVLALVVLMLSGVSDYLDGKIARRFGMESRLGQLLDPFADRLYIATTLFGLAWRDIIPWWLVIALVGREVLLAGVLWWIKRYGQTGLPVHFVGKAATFNLLYAFPLLLLGEGSSTFAAWALPIGWAFAWWGTVLYWVAGVMYIVQARQVVAAHTVPAT